MFFYFLTLHKDFVVKYKHRVFKHGTDTGAEVIMFDMKFDWQPDMATGIEMIDNQHKQILRVGRDIEQIIQRNCINVTQTELLNIVCEIRDFTGYHFYAEEQLMDECHYSDVKHHKEEHRKMTAAVTSFDVSMLKKDPENALREVRDEIQELVFNHMLTEDKKMAAEYSAYSSAHHNKAQKERQDNFDECNRLYGLKICDLDMTYVYLDRDQHNIGRALMVSKEKKSSLGQLATLERNIFFADVFMVSGAIKRAFSPDAIEYGYFEDIDDRLVFHIVPKYKNSSDWGVPFDPRLTSESHGTMDAADYENIAIKLRQELHK
jgi:hemerythrin